MVTLLDDDDDDAHPLIIRCRNVLELASNVSMVTITKKMFVNEKRIQSLSNKLFTLSMDLTATLVCGEPCPILSWVLLSLSK